MRRPPGLRGGWAAFGCGDMRQVDWSAGGAGIDWAVCLAWSNLLSVILYAGCGELFNFMGMIGARHIGVMLAGAFIVLPLYGFASPLGGVAGYELGEILLYIVLWVAAGTWICWMGFYLLSKRALLTIIGLLMGVICLYFVSFYFLFRGIRADSHYNKGLLSHYMDLVSEPGLGHFLYIHLFAFFTLVVSVCLLFWRQRKG